ncbi:MAG: hypothetical protein A3G34_00530 [Candidatus Lindowbacteria bacterium RIFCSPLOWO2_12_FULL_62_27]|nr:MAG: hypothetical protein A3G34_00530 [Candidatus Lindowbacteria bacterium RIFCSPLOWO2_12_FULL_62_27]OGH58199.1 MAG: hypothetical protein A3I06_01025 [Candidatus Lindowbacteria bacterium RIFCSPLOWO2_02_FULL_62_12]
MADELALPKKPDGSNFKILIVDDSEFMIKNLERILTGMGADVLDSALDGLQAVEKYKKLMPNIDLVTLDITMPNMSGIDALAAIRSADPKARVVMVSALGHQDIVKTAILKGAKHFVVKPFKAEKVFEVLKLVLSKPA